MNLTMVLLLIRAIIDTNTPLYTFPNTTMVAMLNLAVFFCLHVTIYSRDTSNAYDNK